MKAHETPSGTKMMWNARVKAICERAHGTGSTASTGPASPARTPPVIGRLAILGACHRPGPRWAPRPPEAGPLARRRSSGESVGEVLADPDGVGHGRERRVHRADAREEARVDDVEVVDLMRLAVGVEHRRSGVGAEPAGARLVGDAGHRDIHVHVEV